MHKNRLIHTVFSRSMLLAGVIGVCLILQNRLYLIQPLLKGAIDDLGIYMDFYFTGLDTGGFLIFTPLLAVLPGISLFCDEYESGYIRFVLTRQAKKKYMCRCIVNNAVAGGCAVSFPLMFVGLITLLFCEPYTQESLAGGHHTPLYNTLMEPLEFIWGGFICVPIIIGFGFLFGVVWSTIGLAVASIHPNRYLALCVPLLIYFFLHLGFNAFGLDLYSPTNTILPNVLPSYWFLFIYQGILLGAALAVLIPSMKRRLDHV